MVFARSKIGLCSAANGLCLQTAAGNLQMTTGYLKERSFRFGSLLILLAQLEVSGDAQLIARANVHYTHYR